MPHNSQGLYTLPAGNPVSPGTTIESTWANTTLDDVAQGLSDSLPRNGAAPMTGALTLANSSPTDARHATSKKYVDQLMAYASGMPVGSISAYAGSAAPQGWLKCDGSAVSRTTYSTLFGVIGTTYGAGDQSTTFNLPDLRNEFIRGRPDSRAIGSKVAGSYLAHTHGVNDPGHAHEFTPVAHTHGITDPGHDHTAYQTAHNHTITTGSHAHSVSITSGTVSNDHTHTFGANTGGMSANAVHGHGVSDPGHAHGYTGVPGVKYGSGGSILNVMQESGNATGAAGTGIGVQNANTDHVHYVSGTTGGISANHSHSVVGSTASVGSLGGSTSASEPGVGVNAAATKVSAVAASATGTVNGAATGLSIGASGGAETAPQNMALDYYIKAVNDGQGSGTLVTGIDSSDPQIITINNTNHVVPNLDIKSNIAFGVVKLDASGKVPLGLLPTSNQQFLGYFDASSGQTPSTVYPSINFASGDTYTISVGGTLLVYDPITLVASSTAVVAGENLTYVENSLTNPTGWYYIVNAVIIEAGEVTVVPAGGISATNVQDVLEELDTEKFAKAGGTITGATAIEASSGNALRVTNTGTGNSLLIEDSAATDSTPVVVNASGTVVAGHTAAIGGSKVQAVGGIDSYRFSADAAGAVTNLVKSRGATGAQGLVLDNDNLGVLGYVASDGANYLFAAQIAAAVDGAAGTNDVPGRLVFSTTPNGANLPVERLRINNAGALGLNGANFGASGQTLVSQGSSATPIWANPQAGRTINANDTNAGLLITQTGTGNALVVEDSTSPDSTPVVIDANGRVVVGATNAPMMGGDARVLSLAQPNSNAYFGVGRYTADSGYGGIVICKSRGTTVGSSGALQSSDGIGGILFFGNDGASDIQASSIVSKVDGTPGTNDMPGRLVFSTTPDGSATPVERMRIDSAGRAGLSGAAVSSNIRIARNMSSGTDGASVQSVLCQHQFSGTFTETSHYYAQTRLDPGTSITNAYGFFMTGHNFGAGATCQNFYGFAATSGISAAVNNYGFHSNIPAGTGRWNFYALGTAENYFNGGTWFGSAAGVTGLKLSSSNNGVQSTITGNAATGGQIDLEVLNDGTTGVAVRCFRATNTTGEASFQVLLANGTTSINHILRANNNLTSTICSDNGNVEIGNAAGNPTRIKSGLTIDKTAVTAPVAADGNVFSGTYAPTVTNVANVASSATLDAQYMRVGNVVTVSGRFSLTLTAAGAQTTFNLSLPIASNLSSAAHCCGTFVQYQSAAVQPAGVIFGEATADRAQFRIFGASIGPAEYSFQFTYRVL